MGQWWGWGLALALSPALCLWACFSTGPRFVDPLEPSLFFVATFTITFVIGGLTLAFFKKRVAHGIQRAKPYLFPSILIVSIAVNGMAGVGVLFMSAALALWATLCYRLPHE